MKKTKLN